jgi:hypothetical protein
MVAVGRKAGARFDFKMGGWSLLMLLWRMLSLEALQSFDQVVLSICVRRKG